MRRSGVYVVNEPQDEEAKENGGPQHIFLNRMSDDKEAPVQPLPQIADIPIEVEPQPQIPQLDPVLKPHKPSSTYRTSLIKLLCGLYALLVIVLGIVFSTSTALTTRDREHTYYLEIFLVYLYFVSLAVLLYFQIGLLRGVKVKNTYYEPNIRITIRNENLHKSPTASPTPFRANDQNEVDLTMDHERKDKDADQISLGTYRSQLELPEDGGVAHVGDGINFYLRLGALAFAFGSVTLDGFHIASYFESKSMESCESTIFILVFAMHLLFTFVQTFFLFKNHKLVIDKNKALVRFGMMHLMATNLCVVIVTAVMETADDYRMQDYHKHHSNESAGDQESCYKEVTLGRTASPYLFPCTIIYSIIATGIIYRLYQYIGIKIKQRWPSHTSLTSSVPQGASAIDCEKANKGLFLGLLVGVITLIAIATFFVFENRLLNSVAIKIFYVTEIYLMVITGIGIICGYLRLSQLKFLQSAFFSVDSVLLIVALSGSYIYLCFTVISVAYTLTSDTVTIIFSLVTMSLVLLQITIQTIFILDGLCRCSENDAQMMSKPGRAIVTFLLVCNLAMWAISMFEVKKTRMILMHEAFYGILAWNIVTHLCVPLLIFYRFHSAICLSKIWYNAYQKEKQA